MNNDTLPDFVIDNFFLDIPRRSGSCELTGWETVVFQLDDDDEPDSDSDFSTAAFAP